MSLTAEKLFVGTTPTSDKEGRHGLERLIDADQVSG